MSQIRGGENSSRNFVRNTGGNAPWQPGGRPGRPLSEREYREMRARKARRMKQLRRKRRIVLLGRFPDVYEAGRQRGQLYRQRQCRKA